MADCFPPLAAELVPQNCHFLDLVRLHLEIQEKLVCPVEGIADEGAGVGPICKKFSLILSCIEEVSIDGRKHRVDNLFEVVIDISLSFLAVGSDAILYKGWRYSDDVDEQVDPIEVGIFREGYPL